MQTISKAGFGLLKFVRAVLGYCDVFKEVKPKRDRVIFLENELDLQVKTLDKLTTDINKLQEVLMDLNKKYTNSMNEKQDLQQKLEQAERRLVHKII